MKPAGVRFSLQISHLVQRPDFDLARSRHGIGTALYPSDRLVHVLDLPDPEAGDQLAGLGERPVDDPAAWTVERDTLALRGGLEAVAREQDAGVTQFFVESAHRLEHLGRLGRGENAFFAVFGRLHEHHHAHRLVSLLEPALSAQHRSDERSFWESTSRLQIFFDSPFGRRLARSVVMAGLTRPSTPRRFNDEFDIAPQGAKPSRNKAFPSDRLPPAVQRAKYVDGRVKPGHDASEPPQFPLSTRPPGGLRPSRTSRASPRHIRVQAEPRVRRPAPQI